MNSKEKLYKLLYIALLEIRAEANVFDNKKVFEISNLVHNLPLKLLKATEDSYEKILSELTDSAEGNSSLSDLLRNNLIVK